MPCRILFGTALWSLVCALFLVSCGGKATVSSGGLIEATSSLDLSATVGEALSGRLAVRVVGTQEGEGRAMFVVFSAPAGGPSGKFAGGSNQAVVRVGVSGTAVAPRLLRGSVPVAT